MSQQRVEGELIQGHQRNREEKLVLGTLASMLNTENCGRIPIKIPKNWSVEVVVGAVDTSNILMLNCIKIIYTYKYLLEHIPHSSGYNN